MQGQLKLLTHQKRLLSYLTGYTLEQYSTSKISVPTCKCIPLYAFSYTNILNQKKDRTDDLLKIQTLTLLK